MDRIINLKLIDLKEKKFNCLVEFKTRKDGIKPSNAWVTSDIIRINNANHLLDYYNTFIEFSPKILMAFQ